MINDWAKIQDNKGQLDTFILDFEKAFDIPPHELLKSKLFSYGIGGKTLKWITAFLCYRQRRVVVNDVKSDWALLYQVCHRACSRQGFPLKFYFRGHKIPLTLILEGIWGDFGRRLYNI